MVTLTLGSRWQEKVEEVANLKLEREELRAQVAQLQAETQLLQGRLHQSDLLNKSLEDRLQELAGKQDQSDAVTHSTVEYVQRLQQQLQHQTTRVAELEQSVRDMQRLVDELGKEGECAKGMIGRLQREVSDGDHARSLIEKDRDSWKLQFERKSHEVEILQRSKDHCDKHIAILVKEKDRLMGKKPEVSPVLAVQYAAYEGERPITAPSASNSYQETEILRFRKVIADLKASLASKETEIAKLQKENWAFLTRLRNARK